VTETLTPMFNQVLMRRLSGERKLDSGLIVADNGKGNDAWRAKVLAIGPGEVFMDNGFVEHRAVENVAVDDEVFVPAFAGYKTLIGTQEFLLVKDTEILCKVTRGE